MTRHPFRKRWHRIYFQLLDAFVQPRCPWCALLSEFDRTLISGFFASADKRNTIKTALKALCVQHRVRLKEIGADDPAVLIALKSAVRDSLGAVAHPRRQSTVRWRGWFESFRAGCPLCSQVSSQETVLCRALIRFLEDTEFWKRFQGAPLLCLDHLQKCLDMVGRGVGFERLRNDQSAKLNELLDGLIRFEATGAQSECKSTALDWLAEFAGPTLAVGNTDVSLNDLDRLPELTSETQAESMTHGEKYQEDLAFENEKLTRKVKNLMDRLNDVESRAASLHYRVSRLSEDNKRLEMGYTGANIQADGLQQRVKELQEKIKQLKDGSVEPRAKAAS